MMEVGCCGTDCTETWKLVRSVLAIGEELGREETKQEIMNLVLDKTVKTTVDPKRDLIDPVYVLNDLFRLIKEDI
jgi:hypothetical protein